MTIIYNVRKNKMKACPLINLVILVLHNVLPLTNGMVLHGETLSHWDLIVQKSLQYKHHKLNYIQFGGRYYIIGAEDKEKTGISTSV